MNFWKFQPNQANNIALIDAVTNAALTYSDLDKQIHHFCKELPQNKTLISIPFTNNIQTIIAYLACLKANHSILAYEGNLEKSLKEKIFKQYLPTHHIDTTSAEPLCIKKLHNSKIKVHEELALCLSTSGSTGAPKLVMLSKNNLISNSSSIVNYLSLNQSEKAITSLPLSYSYGLSILNSHLLAGATTVVTEVSVFEKTFWETFKKHKITSLSGIPYTYEILNKIRFQRMSLPSLKTLTQAGGRLPPKLVQAFAQFARTNKIRFFVMYGQTEATARISYVPPNQILDNLDSIGTAIPGGSLYLENENKEKITTPNIEGQLIYEGDNVMMGYAESYKDLSSGDQSGGRLATGDLAILNNNGYFTIKGRLKRFIKIHGKRISLDQIEHLLNIEFSPCVCCGIDNYLIVATNYNNDVAAIEKHILDKIKLHSSVYKVLFLKQFPKNNSGKIQYNKLLEHCT